MNNTFDAYSTTWVTTSGTGVLGATGQPVYLQGALIASLTGTQAIAFYSGTTTVTMALVTLTGRGYQRLPIPGPGGLTYQTLGNPGDADLKLMFFWVPGVRT